MKKLICVIICIISICFFCSCENNINRYVKENLSDARYYIFNGENEEFFASFTCGKRENPYFIDGFSNDNVEFGIIEVMFYQDKVDDYITVDIIIDNNITKIQLEKNPITFTYMYDLEKIYNEESKISIDIDNKKLNLENQTKNWKINFNKALNIGIQTFKNFINTTKKNKTPVEFYLKIIGKANAYENNYFYWCFTIRGENIYKSCAIDISSGEVLTKT